MNQADVVDFFLAIIKSSLQYLIVIKCEDSFMELRNYCFPIFSYLPICVAFIVQKRLQIEMAIGSLMSGVKT